MAISVVEIHGSFALFLLLFASIMPLLVCRARGCVVVSNDALDSEIGVG